MKIYRVFSILLIFFVCTALHSNEIKEEEQAELLCDWHKIVIQNNKAITIIPYKVAENRLKEKSWIKLPMLTVDLDGFTDQIQTYNCDLLKHNERSGTILFYPHAFREDNKYLPFAWDLNNDVYSYVNYYSTAGSYGMNFQISSINYKDVIKTGSYKAINYRYFFDKVVKSAEMYYYYKDEHKYRDYKYTYYGDIECVYHRIIGCNDNTKLLFLHNRNNVFVFKANANKDAIKVKNSIPYDWTFQYAFNLPFTKPFEVFLSDNTLYILNKERGIYKIDVQKAINNSPEIPNMNSGGTSSDPLFFHEFDNAELTKNLLKATKISDLKFNHYIDNKDTKIGYVASHGYIYQIGNFEKRVKINDIVDEYGFIDYQAVRMYNSLSAMIKLKDWGEKTPEELLKVTPDSEIDKMLAEKEAKNADNLGSDDGDDSNNNANAGNGEASVDNDDDSDMDNNSGSSENTNNDDPENSDSALTKDSNKDVDGENNKTDSDRNSISDGTNLFTYIGISVGSIILLTLIFLVLFRKRR